MQPLHMEGLDDPDPPSAWREGLSAGRASAGFRSGDLARSGAVLPLGSDWMVADFDPRFGWRGRGCGARRSRATASRFSPLRR